MRALDKHVSFVSIEETRAGFVGLSNRRTPFFKPMEIFVYGASRSLPAGRGRSIFSALLRNHDGKTGGGDSVERSDQKTRRPGGEPVFRGVPEVGGYYHRAFGLPDDSPTGKMVAGTADGPCGPENPSPRLRLQSRGILARAHEADIGDGSENNRARRGISRGGDRRIVLEILCIDGLCFISHLHVSTPFFVSSHFSNGCGTNGLRKSLCPIGLFLPYLLFPYLETVRISFQAALPSINRPNPIHPQIMLNSVCRS